MLKHRVQNRSMRWLVLPAVIAITSPVTTASMRFEHYERGVRSTEIHGGRHRAEKDW
jgi:hypothetical protein